MDFIQIVYYLTNIIFFVFKKFKQLSTYLIYLKSWFSVSAPNKYNIKLTKIYILLKYHTGIVKSCIKLKYTKIAIEYDMIYKNNSVNSLFARRHSCLFFSCSPTSFTSFCRSLSHLVHRFSLLLSYISAIYFPGLYCMNVLYFITN